MSPPDAHILGKCQVRRGYILSRRVKVRGLPDSKTQWLHHSQTSYTENQNPHQWVYDFNERGRNANDLLDTRKEKQ